MSYALKDKWEVDKFKEGREDILSCERMGETL